MNKYFSILAFSILISTLFQGCITIPNQFSALAPGVWRGVLKLDGRVFKNNPQAKPLTEDVGSLTFEPVMDGELPFNFEVIYDNDTTFHIEIINGEERIVLEDIIYGLDRSTAKDTVIINFPIYESYIKAIYEEDVMEGVWVVPSRGEYEIPFVAYHAKDYRFTNLRKKPVMDLTGKWEVTFEVDTEDSYPAIGEFVQEGNELTGTFLTETGDYRYLEGTVQANKVYLSVFDGAHAFLFEAKILEDETMIGSFRSGKHYKTTWIAKKNPAVTLADPNDLTYLKEGYDRVDFSFESTEGKMVSLADEAYQNKIKVVQIFGTWCPNCRDETNFLLEYLKENNHPDLEVISLGFEKYRERDKAMKSLKFYKEKLNVPYPMLLAGYANKQEAAEAMPMLNHILSYPTMIFIDKNNQVRKIHTGFAGPATSQYADFKKEFDEFLKELLAE